MLAPRATVVVRRAWPIRAAWYDAAPNPATYWEDRIAEEYPKGEPRLKKGGAPGKSLADLFRDADDPGDA